MITLERTSTSNPQFLGLVVELDKELWARYPLVQQKYAPHNKVDITARVVLAFFDKNIAGCGCFRPMEEQDTVEIKRMYVVPFLRGRGIAGSILNELEEWANEESFIQSKLETGRNQPEAIALYKKYQYTIIPNYPPYTHMEESICMGKRLS
jgi:putative acetyltransferase